MALPQLGAHKNFFSPNFGNAIATIRVSHFFFLPIFGNDIATIRSHKIFFSPNFGNAIVTIIQKFLSPTFYLSLSSFYWISVMVLPQFILFPQIAITPINFEFYNI